MVLAGFLALCSYALGLFALAFGLSMVVREQVRLTWFSTKVIRGPAARRLGVLCILMALAYLAVVIWAWSFYDR